MKRVSATGPRARSATDGAYVAFGVARHCCSVSEKEKRSQRASPESEEEQGRVLEGKDEERRSAKEQCEL
ncbi:hypothetical protein [Asaia astilbis]|uniref:hypothetical protein n=1 Tax=Asaia astilbis TaxID=610244 RepID=UPI001E3620C1|nr:hypothetical protein [Asaia astilbis]